MTLDEFLNMPKGTNIVEYQKSLCMKKKEENRIRSLASKIQECEDALDVLSDEEGSERWKRWSEKLDECMKKMNQLKK